MIRALVLLVGLAAASGACAQELGRLFFTPEQRAALDARRKARVPDKPAAAPVVASPVTRLDGYVQRSDGRATVWVNGTALDEAAPEKPVVDSARVSMTVGEGSARVRLKPGETIDRGSGEVADLLGTGGEIRVGRQR